LALSHSKIAEKYGKNSPQWTAAVELIDATVLYSLSTLRDCAFEIVYLPALSNERSKVIPNRKIELTSSRPCKPSSLLSLMALSLRRDFLTSTLIPRDKESNKNYAKR
jgi:hypothetical protein